MQTFAADSNAQFSIDIENFTFLFAQLTQSDEHQCVHRAELQRCIMVVCPLERTSGFACTGDMTTRHARSKQTALTQICFHQWTCWMLGQSCVKRRRETCCSSVSVSLSALEKASRILSSGDVRLHFRHTCVLWRCISQSVEGADLGWSQGICG